MQWNRFLPLAVLLLAAGCSGDLAHEAPFDPDSPLAKQAKASLSGVIKLQGEKDVGGVAVRLVNSERAYDFTTANDGLVELPGIVPGSYTLTVSTRYFQPVEREITFALGERKTLDPIQLKLSTSKVTGSALARSVRDKEEIIVGGVKLVLTKLRSMRQGASAAPAALRAAADTTFATDPTTYTAFSNADGTYTIDEVAAGEYAITASNDEVAPQDAGTLTVTGEGDVAAQDVLLQPLAGYFSIRGTGAEGPSELYTGTPSVTLLLNALGATKVKIGSSANGTKAGCAFPNPAVDLNGNLTPAYTIPAPGLHTVCVRFVDANGAETDSQLGSIIYDNQAPQFASALINDGAAASASQTVGVRFSATEAETNLHAYQIANTSAVDWNAQAKFAYQPTVLHPLAGEGLQTVYARFQDAAGNWTGVVSASIEVSTVAPTVASAYVADESGGVVAAGATTRSNRAYLRSAVTSQTSLQMQVSTTGSYAGIGWEAYSVSKAVDLPPQSGFVKEQRQVSARVRDAVGRIVDLVAQTFYLDSRGPTGSVLAPASATSLDVALTFAVNDPEAVVEVAENPAFVGAVAFAQVPATTYTLAGGADGLRTLYVRFTDAAGNASAVVSATVQLDRTPPQLPSFSIRQGALTKSQIIDLDLAALDAAEMSVAENTSCTGGWEPYATVRALTLVDADGDKTIAVKFRDAALNETACLTKTITYDKTPPTFTSLAVDGGAPYARARSVSLALAYAAATEMRFAESTVFTAPWQAVTSSTTYELSAGDGPKSVYVELRDAAGNTVTGGPDLITLDTAAPSGTLTAPQLANSLTIPLTLTTNDLAARVDLADNPGFVGAASFAYQAATSYTFAVALDGLRTVYARLVDAAGNASPLLAAVVNVDTTAPQLAAVAIRQGAITNLRDIDLDLTALDAAQMSVAEGAACAGGWENFAASKQLTFALDADGVKTVAVKFRDAALNETACLTKTITYDKTPPVPGQFQINGGAPYARERAVTLSLAVTDATEMQIAETAVFSGAWQPVTTTVNYTLSAGDGVKTLYVQFRDLAGNTAQATPATIQLDTVGPEQPLVTVNDGSGYARQVTATLTLSATGSPAHYRWTVDGIIDNKPWLPFTTSTSVSLGAGADGARTVAVQFKDAAENLSLAAQANVELDREVPSSPSIRIDDGALTTRDTAGLVTLTLNAADTGSGLEKVRLAPTQAGLASAGALPFEPTKIYTLDNYTVDGVKPVWVSFYDKAGNYSTPVSAVIKLDRTPPAALLTLPAGSLSSTGIVPIDIAADADTVEMQVWSNPGPPPGPWQPFESALTYTFPAVEGPATFFVRLRDDAGNDSAPFNIGVSLDLSPPVMTNVAGAVISDTLVWDDLNPDTVSYAVYLFDGGAVKTITNTTDTRLYVGRMNPGFTVVAKYADGTTSAFSQPPGYAVPPTLGAFIGLRAGAKENALLARLAQQYGLGATTAGCGQVVFTNEWNSNNGVNPPSGGPGGGGGPGGMPNVSCAGSNPIRMLGESYTQAPPGFDAAIAAAPNNPFAGLPPLRISGGGRTYFYSPSDNPNTPLLMVPGWLKWQGANYPLAQTGDVVASIGLFNPAAGAGENEIRLFFPLAAMAVTDDVAVYYTPSTASPQAYGYLGSQGLSLAAAGRFAGIDVTQVDYRNRYYDALIALNGLGGTTNYYSYAQPGTIRLPLYADQGTAAGQTLALASIWPNCTYTWDPFFGYQYACEDYGQSASFDVTASTLTLLDHNPHWDDNWREYAVANSDGSRSYRLPFPNDGVTTFYWRDEYDQAAIEGYLRAMIRRMAAPVRVRGTGIPVLTNQVAGATEMLVGLDAAFTGAAWQAYAAEITLPEGTQTVWVRYRDDAGNVTASQEVAIAAPEQAPQIEGAVILGTAGNPGYTTGENVNAYVIGRYPSAVQVRMSTSPAFDDAGWVSAEGPLNNLSLTDPLTGEVKEANLDGMQLYRLPLTIPATPGTYTYYFWVKDASRNFSRGAAASVIYDTTEPEAEFSLKPGAPGELQLQAQWTVTKSPILPSLAALAPTPATTFTLPFAVPFLTTASSELWIDDAKACLQVGYLSACALEKLTDISDHTVTVSAGQAVVVWRGHGPYGTPVTTAATVAADGSVRLSYWNTGARVKMYGQVDQVETPYADFDYAAFLGSVEYRPNTLPLQFLLRSHTGKLEKVSVPKRTIQDQGNGYWSLQSPWRNVQVDDRGVVRYTGVAYSLAGAAGQVTERDVYVRGGAWDDAMLTNVKSAPLTDTRRWLTWELGDDNYTTAFRVAGTRAGFGAQAGALDSGVTRLSEAHQRPGEPYERGRTQWPMYTQQGPSVEHEFGPALVVVDDGSLATSGVPVTPDFASRLLFGADGSIWDLADPRRPAAVRAFAGSYPFVHGATLKVGRYLWTGAGIYDVSSPEAPVRVAGTNSPRSSFVAFQGRVYEISQWQYWVYDSSNPTMAPSSGSFATTGAGEEIFKTGGRLLSFFGDLIGIDLTLPVPDTYSAGYIGYYQGWVDADARFGDNSATAGLGFLRYISDGYAVYPRFKDSGMPGGTPLLWDVRRLSVEGPWLFGTGIDALHVAHVGRALPDRLAKIYTTVSGYNPLVAVDERYIYICDGVTLKLYTPEGAPVKSGTVKGCNDLAVTYPYVVVGNGYRYRVDGAIVEEPLKFCDPFSSSGYCPEGNHLGSAWKDWNRKVYLGNDLLLPLSDTACEPVGATDSLLLCYEWSTGDIKGAPIAELRYRGVVTGPNTLPLTKLLNDGSQVFDAMGEYFSTNVGTYFVEGLQAVQLVGPGSLNFVAPGFAADNSGNLFELDGGGMRRVAQVSTGGVVRPSAGGVLAVAAGSNVWTTKWGPGLSEYRKSMPNSAQARDLVSAAGYVYMATPGGLARTDGLMLTAQAVPRNDVTVRHAGNAWTLLGPDRRPVTTVVETTPGTMADLCETLLKRKYSDPEQPWNPPVENVCNWNENVTTGTVFEGDLGGQWLGLRGVSVDPIGNVSSLAVDTAGRVYAGVQTSAASTGVYMYDPIDTGLVAVGVLATGAVLDLAVTDDTLYVLLDNGDLTAYDLSTGLTPLWTQVGTGAQRVRAVPGWLAVSGNIGGPVMLDPMTGFTTSWCGSSGGDFEFSTRRWGGNLHTVFLSLSWNSVDVIDAQTCALVESLQMLSASDLRNLRLESGFVLVGDAAGQLFITQQNEFSKPHAFTIVQGPEPIEQGVIVGPFVYTVGDGAGQIFQLH